MNRETRETNPQIPNKANTICGKSGNFAINGSVKRLKLNNANPWWNAANEAMK